MPNATYLIRALRWTQWPPDEAYVLARRRDRRELAQRHLDAAITLYPADRDACCWHAARIADLHRREVRHV